MMENDLNIGKFFREQGWTDEDLALNQWTKYDGMKGVELWYLGSQKDEDGRAINCNGGKIDAKQGTVTLGKFSQYGAMKKPFAEISKTKFEIKR